jgi:MFS family permease
MARRTLHYAWVVALVTFIILLVTAGVRATPGVLMLALEREFGWSRAVISSAVAINIALFGMIGPFAASVMDRWGVRRVILAAVALLSASVALTTPDAVAVAADTALGCARRHGYWRYVDGPCGNHCQSLVR